MTRELAIIRDTLLPLINDNTLHSYFRQLIIDSVREYLYKVLEYLTEDLDPPHNAEDIVFLLYSMIDCEHIAYDIYRIIDQLLYLKPYVMIVEKVRREIG